MRKFAIAVVSASVLLAACSKPNNEQSNQVVEQAVAEVPTYNAETFFQTTSFGIAGADGAFSNDGKKLLISSDETGIFNVYELDLETNERKALTQSVIDSSFAVSYMPDNKRFLFSADQGGNELNHLYLVEEGKELRDLTPGENVKASFAGWTNDKSAFFVVTNERDPKYFDLYRYDASTFERTRVFMNNKGYGGYTISGDGSLAITSIQNSGTDSDLYLLNLSDQSVKQLTNNPEDVSYAAYTFTPEGDAVIIGSDEGNEFTQAYRYDLKTGKSSKLFNSDWDVSSVSYSPSGKYRIQSINADAVSQVSVIERESGKTIAMPKALPKGQLSSIRFSPDEKIMALMVNSSKAPRNIYSFQLGGAEVDKHTEAFTGNIDPNNLVESEVIRYKSYDGLEIPSILYKPKTASSTNKVPALVWVHGGPGGQSRVGYSAAIQHLVNNGYAILAANNRGSSGYGKTFFHADDLRHGEADLDDIVEAKTYLQSLDWVNPDKVGIIGGSYGGYMTMAALAFRPEEFEVGINIFGVTNWVRTLNSIPPWWESFRASLYSELGDPAEHEERLRRISPLFHASNITKPVLVVQGANDPRVLQVESDEMVAAVKANNVPVEYVLFPDEGHGFTKRENRVAASNAYLSFLKQHMPAK